jgi:lysophospholipase
LAYLLSKPDLNVENVRQLIGSPLRGEITAPSVESSHERPWSEETEEIVQRIVKLTPPLRVFSSSSGTPLITLSGDGNESINSLADEGLHESSKSTENALRVMLIHLAVSRDEVEQMQYAAKINGNGENDVMDWINAADVASGQSPLHTAAIRGAKACAARLLECGALVHKRDALDHTPFYYVSTSNSRNILVSDLKTKAIQQGHKDIAEMLLQSGAHLMGADLKNPVSAYM